jgi:hypothetical protein
MRSGYVKELIDLSITAPVGGSGHGKFALTKDRRLAGTQGRQANDTVREKRKKYEPLCNLAPPDKRLFFTPFVLESTGYLHEDAVNV